MYKKSQGFNSKPRNTEVKETTLKYRKISKILTYRNEGPRGNMIIIDEIVKPVY